MRAISLNRRNCRLARFVAKSLREGTGKSIVAQGVAAMQRSNEPKRAIPQNCRRYGFARSAARSFWRRARRNIAAKNALSTLIIIGLRTIPLNCRKHVFARSAARSLRERKGKSIAVMGVIAKLPRNAPLRGDVAKR